MHIPVASTLAASCLVAGVTSSVLPPTVQLGPTGVHRGGSLAKRGDMPDECDFTGENDQDYWYQTIRSGDDVLACIAGPTAAVGASYCLDKDGNLKKEHWPQEDKDAIIDVASYQVTKDGGDETSESGNWQAIWMLGTTAVPDREAYFNYFQLGMSFAHQCDITSDCSYQGRTYYYNMGGDKMLVKHKDSNNHDGYDPYGYCP